LIARVFVANKSRRMLCYPVSAFLTLIMTVIDNPSGVETRADIGLIDSLIAFLKRVQDEGGCDLQKVLVGCSELRDIAVVPSATRNDAAVARSLQGDEEARHEVHARREVCYVPWTVRGIQVC
jgi:hypothetical protein